MTEKQSDTTTTTTATMERTTRTLRPSTTTTTEYRRGTTFRSSHLVALPLGPQAALFAARPTDRWDLALGPAVVAARLSRSRRRQPLGAMAAVSGGGGRGK